MVVQKYLTSPDQLLGVDYERRCLSTLHAHNILLSATIFIYISLFCHRIQNV